MSNNFVSPNYGPLQEIQDVSFNIEELHVRLNFLNFVTSAKNICKKYYKCILTGKVFGKIVLVVKLHSLHDQHLLSKSLRKVPV